MKRTTKINFTGETLLKAEQAGCTWIHTFVCMYIRYSIYIYNITRAWTHARTSAHIETQLMTFSLLPATVAEAQCPLFCSWQ